MEDTKAEILNLIQSGIGIDDIYKIYQVLYDREFFSRSDFDKDYTWFRDLVLEHLDDIVVGSSSKDRFVKKVWIEKYIRISPTFNWIFNSHPASFQKQNEFADTVADIVGKGNYKILEVGCGAIPYASMCLAEEYGYVKALDTALEKGVQHDVLSRMCIDSSPVYFGLNVSLSDVDLVVGQKPCPSIEMIVDRCVNEGKPYIIEACNCGEPDGGWKKYLHEKYNTKVYDCNNVDIVYDMDV